MPPRRKLSHRLFISLGIVCPSARLAPPIGAFRRSRVPLILEAPGRARTTAIDRLLVHRSHFRCSLVRLAKLTHKTTVAIRHESHRGSRRSPRPSPLSKPSIFPSVPTASSIDRSIRNRSDPSLRHTTTRARPIVRRGTSFIVDDDEDDDDARDDDDDARDDDDDGARSTSSPASSSEPWTREQ